MTKRWLLLLVFLAITASAILWVRAARHQPRISIDSYNQIQEGMSQAEVEAILGGPPGDYSSRKWAGETRVGFPGGILSIGPLDNDRAKNWSGEELTITLWFDPAGRVIGRSASPEVVHRATLKGRLYRWWLKAFRA